MATRTFEIRTEPHEATVGDTVLLFQPEVEGREFVAAYTALRASQKGKSKTKADPDDVDPEELAKAAEALRTFLARFMLPESLPAFEGLKLPDRILIDLMHWVVELYGSGAKDRPTG